MLLESTVGAIASANMRATFFGPGHEHWPRLAILDATRAGELAIKATIAKVHTLLIFKDAFSVYSEADAEVDIETLVSKARSHDFSKLPNLLWVVTGKRIEARNLYMRAAEIRNSVQHFITIDEAEASEVALEFLYRIVDPLVREEFGLSAVNCFEGYDERDYIVERLVRAELPFSIPSDFGTTEIDLGATIQETTESYQKWLASELIRQGHRSLVTWGEEKDVRTED